MDLFSVLGACLRRWYVTLPLLVVTGLLTVLAYDSVESEYTGSVSFVILPSLDQEANEADDLGSEEEPVGLENPYAGQGGSRFVVAVLTRSIDSTAFRERIGLEDDSTRRYEASSSDQQPVVTIDATARSEAAVYDLLDLVTEEAAVVLEEFQGEAGAAEETFYRTAPAVPAGPAEDVTPSRFRAAGAIGVVGLAMAAAVATALDAMLGRRRRGEAENEPSTPTPDEGTPTADREGVEPDTDRDEDFTAAIDRVLDAHAATETTAQRRQ